MWPRTVTNPFSVALYYGLYDSLLWSFGATRLMFVRRTWYFKPGIVWRDRCHDVRSPDSFDIGGAGAGT